MSRKAALGIRQKLIGIFVLIKLIPLVVLSWYAWEQISRLGATVASESDLIAAGLQRTMQEVGTQAAADSVAALDVRAQESLERITVERARAVADFLYARDADILLAADLEPDEAGYRRFLSRLQRPLIVPPEYRLNAAGTAWEAVAVAEVTADKVEPGAEENRTNFHYRPPEPGERTLNAPLYLEMSFIGLDGRERVKVGNGDLLAPELRDIRQRENTFVRAETYWNDIAGLKPGQIWVSDVIGAYVPSPVIGPFIPAAAQRAGIPFEPEKYAFAGEENPVGRRFQGLMRWVTPVVRQGRTIGWVTLALDHRHLMAFTDHLLPTDERFSAISDAGRGNYAFMWDHLDRNIAHPRDYFIHGYDPETGEEVESFMDGATYRRWKDSGLAWAAFRDTLMPFAGASLSLKPDPVQIRSGRIPLLCAYVGIAPQCEGWHNLTAQGGSGSFLIFWSGIWKLTTAAAIPYHTGRFGADPRGFGFITFGANVDVFQAPAQASRTRIESLVAAKAASAREQRDELQTHLFSTLEATARGLTVSTLVMVLLVIFIAVWMAWALTRRITQMTDGIRRFQQGDLEHRLPVGSGDEMGQLATAFNAMADQLAGMLRSSQEHYRLLAHNIRDVLWILAPDLRLMHVSPSVKGLLGQDAEVLMQQPLSALFVADSFRELEAAVVALTTTGGGEAIRRLELEQPHADGHTVWTECVLSPLRDEEGALIGVLMISRDISARREADLALRAAKERAEENFRQLEAARESLVQSEKLASLGGLVAGVAHEINTPVGIALTSATHLRSEAEALRRLYESEQLSPANLEDYLADALEATRLMVSNVQRAAELIQSFKRVAVDQSSGERRSFDLRAYLQEVLQSLGPRLKRTRVRIELECPDGVMVDGYPGALSQVLTNLVMNSLTHAFDPDQPGQIRLRVSSRDEWIELCFEDDGKGIPPAVLPRIFDPFFTTRRGAGGSGLGLNIVYTVVTTTMQGQIRAESVPGQGARFVLGFPRVVTERPASPDSTSES